MENQNKLDSEDYDNYLKHLDHGTNESKKRIISEVLNNGEKLLNEIDIKMRKREIQKNDYIKYITKHSTDYDTDDLKNYHYTEIEEIYNQLKIEKKSLFSKIVRFVFNV